MPDCHKGVSMNLETIIGQVLLTEYNYKVWNFNKELNFKKLSVITWANLLKLISIRYNIKLMDVLECSS